MNRPSRFPSIRAIRLVPLCCTHLCWYLVSQSIWPRQLNSTREARETLVLVEHRLPIPTEYVGQKSMRGRLRKNLPKRHTVLPILRCQGPPAK
jgi:hypothetical protein